MGRTRRGCRLASRRSVSVSRLAHAVSHALDRKIEVCAREACAAAGLYSVVRRVCAFAVSARWRGLRVASRRPALPHELTATRTRTRYSVRQHMLQVYKFAAVFLYCVQLQATAANRPGVLPPARHCSPSPAVRI